MLPDFFIGAHAAIAGMPLRTRDATRCRTCFPTLRLRAVAREQQDDGSGLAASQQEEPTRNQERHMAFAGLRGIGRGLISELRVLPHSALKLLHARALLGELLLHELTLMLR